MAPFRIASPGIFADISANDYHADPCPTPSFTQSIAKLLLDHSALHAWHAHPRLNPAFEPDDPTKFDIANAAHTYLLGRGRDLVIVEAEDWRTKIAQETRKAAIAQGKQAVLGGQAERAAKMAAAAHKQLKAAGFADAFEFGDAEAVIAWREGDVWFRSMIDWLDPDRRIVWDLKTTRASAAPHALPSKMADDGWCIQAAMHERGLAVLDPKNAGRRKHRFVCQECEEPYALTITEISEAAMTMGRKQLDYAVELWSRCMAVGTNVEAWPGYPFEIQRPDYPGWAESRWLEREVTEEARRGEPRISVAGGTYQ